MQALKGEFFGTDFNFLYSEEMQRAIATNCLSANWDSLMNFSQHQSGQIHEEIGQYVNNNGMQLDLDQQINEIVRESFKTTKKYIWKGVFCFLFYFAALYTLKDGVLPIMAQTFPGTESSTSSSSGDDAGEAAGSLKADAIGDLGSISESMEEAVGVVVEEVEENQGKEVVEDFTADESKEQAPPVAD